MCLVLVIVSVPLISNSAISVLKAGACLTKISAASSGCCRVYSYAALRRRQKAPELILVLWDPLTQSLLTMIALLKVEIPAMS